jgi:hypothetical protein
VLTTFSNTGSQNIVYAMSASVASGSWNIVHGTFGSQQVALFVNGLNVSTALVTGSTVGYNTLNRLYAGSNYGSTSGYYSGSIANIIVNNVDLNLVTVNKNYNALATRFGLKVIQTGITDIDVLNFINATGIDNNTQAVSINTLVVGLKSNNLWTKMVAVYPFIGGTATTHKYNLKDPRDVDNAYRILWNGAIIHSSKGVAFNRSSYGDTRLEPFQVLTNPTQSSHGAIYISGSTPYTDNDGALGNSGFGSDGISITVGVQNRMGDYSNIPITVTDTNGLAVTTRRGLTDASGYIRGAVNRTVDTTTAPSTAGTVANIWIGKMNTSGWSGTPTSTVFSFSSIGTGLTQVDVENLYTLVQAYNTSLNRAYNQ